MVRVQGTTGPSCTVRRTKGDNVGCRWGDPHRDGEDRTVVTVLCRILGPMGTVVDCRTHSLYLPPT